MERKQRKNIKIIPGLREKKSYEKRLKEMNLFTLSKCRLQWDCIYECIIFRCSDSISIHDYLLQLPILEAPLVTIDS